MDKLAERFNEQYGSMENVGVREIIPYLALKKMPNVPEKQRNMNMTEVTLFSSLF